MLAFRQNFEREFLDPSLFFQNNINNELSFKNRLIKKQNYDQLNNTAVKMISTDKEFAVVVYMSGLDKDSLQVSIEKNVLTLKGEKVDEKVTEVKFSMRERSGSKLDKSFKLPDGVDADNIAAEYKNGVLLITLPKVTEIKPRQIHVQ